MNEMAQVQGSVRRYGRDVEKREKDVGKERVKIPARVKSGPHSFTPSAACASETTPCFRRACSRRVSAAFIRSAPVSECG